MTAKFKAPNTESNEVLELLNFSPYRPLLQITPSNWKVLIYISIIVSVKYLVDRNIWNIDMVNILALFDLKNTNKFEHLFLGLLDFNTYV